MKTLFLLATVLLSSNSYARQRFVKNIICTGVGVMKGTFWDKKKDTTFNFNDPKVRLDNEDHVPGDGTVPFLLGHSAVVGSKQYWHDPLGGAGCKRLGQGEIECVGFGVGNGPSLKIVISTKTKIGTGTYFNPDASRGVYYSDDYNTYRYDRLECRFN